MDVKGGIVIEQLKRYAKRLSDSSGKTTAVQIYVWCHVYEGNKNIDLDFKASVADDSGFIKPRFKTEDLRDLGAAITDYINGNKKTGKENGKWMKK